MPLLRTSLVLLATVAAANLVRADTIDFSVTITRQQNLSSVPIGTVYTGFVHYNGSVDPNFTGAPPAVTSYRFNYPTAPASLSDLRWAYVQRHAIGQPLFVGLAYVDLFAPAASFDFDANTFTLFTATNETPNGFGYSAFESGPVTYTYVTDPVSPVGPVSPVPEPASLALVGSGILTALGLRRGGAASK